MASIHLHKIWQSQIDHRLSRRVIPHAFSGVILAAKQPSHLTQSYKSHGSSFLHLIAILFNMLTIATSSLLHCRLPVRPHPRRSQTVVSASTRRDGADGRGGLVDENMIVLRKRIHETKMAERNYEPPTDWMEWEKHYYTSYDSDICELLGLLQTLLMNTRPSVAVGLLALLLFSVPTSLIFVSSHLLRAIAYYFLQ